jgi:hypothetical protein
VQLFNLAGQKLRSWTWNAGNATMQLDLSGLASGMYVVSVQSGRALGIRKVAVQ